MPNRDSRPPKKHRRGEKLTAQRLNAIVENTTRLLTTGKGVKLVAFGQQAVIGSPREKTRNPLVGLRAKLKTNQTAGDLLEAVLLDQNGNEVGSTILIARPPELQASYYDGKLIGGVTYTKVDQDNRTGDDGSSETVTPAYVDNSSILTIVRMPGGTGLADIGNSRPVIWQDVTPRIWLGESSVGFKEKWTASTPGTLTHGTQATVAFDGASEADLAFRVGSGLTFNDGTDTWTVGAALNGKVIRVSAQISMIAKSADSWPEFVARIDTTNADGDVYSVQNGMTQLLYGVSPPNAHGHEALASFGSHIIQVTGIWKVSTGETFRLRALQSNDNSDSYTLQASLCWMSFEEVA